MRRTNSFVLIIAVLISLQGCYSSRRFSNTILVETTDLKHQKNTGQCWSFASTSFLEAEAKRLGYDVPELSSFFFVYYNYLDNAKDYLENKGISHLNTGDLTFSVLEVFEDYGAIPESVYNGKLSTVLSRRQMLNRWHEEDKMNALIKVKLDSLVKTDSKVDQSLEIIENILVSYIGEIPETFTLKGETFSPKTFANNYLPFNTNNYFELTSYNHHPFYSNVMLEIPANWRNKTYLNLPIEDFTSAIDNAINNGFTLAWDGDIGSIGGFKNNGYVKVKGEYENEVTINQEQRQSAYDRKTTTDDHNMHLVGITYDRDGQKFYILKNTWGEDRGIEGIWYLSENYFRLRTISVTIHKDAIPKGIMSKIRN